MRRDEAGNCVILISLIRRLGGTPSTATGDFVGKALKIEGRVARLKFLNRGQDWVARKICEALPGLEDAAVRDALAAMHESHLLNIEACEALVETLEELRRLQREAQSSIVVPGAGGMGPGGAGGLIKP